MPEGVTFARQAAGGGCGPVAQVMPGRLAGAGPDGVLPGWRPGITPGARREPLLLASIQLLAAVFWDLVFWGLVFRGDDLRRRARALRGRNV
jgi:hypothetical protein